MAGRPLKPLLDAIEDVLKALGEPRGLASAVKQLQNTHKKYLDDCHSICVPLKPKARGAKRGASPRRSSNR